MLTNRALFRFIPNSSKVAAAAAVVVAEFVAPTANVCGRRRMSSSINTTTKRLQNLVFDNRVLKGLPIDPIEENYERRVSGACFSRVAPTPLRNPRLVVYSRSALKLIDLDHEEVNVDNNYFVQCFAGNQIIPGSQPAAQCYAGHQFGFFAGQLGDGAAHYLGEIVNSQNERWELQLKGSGKTPYSREADGRKVLRSSLREFLCSEAMFHLGIPTTRAATCIVADDQVNRDPMEQGRIQLENCAVISRLAPSFLRFGTFEIFKPLSPGQPGADLSRTGPSFGRPEFREQLADYVIATLYPTIDMMNVPKEEKYRLFFKEVVNKTASLVALWQTVGFVHGVLNTDNMSLLGLTLDYGPFGFMDCFEVDLVPNLSDHEGRYSYDQQPEICRWNLKKLAEALAPLAGLSPLMFIIDENYYSTYSKCYFERMMAKFGLFKSIDAGEELTTDEDLVGGFLNTLVLVGGDFTNCFRSLSLLSLPVLEDFEDSLRVVKEKLVAESSTYEEIIEHYVRYIQSEMVSNKIMTGYIGDDHKSRLILEKITRFQQLRDLSPEEYRQETIQFWNEWLEKYIARLRHEVRDVEDRDELRQLDARRKELMNKTNPRYVLRNYMAQHAIERANEGDFGEARQLLRALEQPYTENAEFDHYARKPPSCQNKVSCSS